MIRSNKNTSYSREAEQLSDILRVEEQEPCAIGPPRRAYVHTVHTVQYIVDYIDKGEVLVLLPGHFFNSVLLTELAQKEGWRSTTAGSWCPDYAIRSLMANEKTEDPQFAPQSLISKK